MILLKLAGTRFAESVVRWSSYSFKRLFQCLIEISLVQWMNKLKNYYISGGRKIPDIAKY